MPRSIAHHLGSAGFLAKLAEPFTGEALFDCLADMVFFIKDNQGRYVVVNQTLVNRCRLERKEELLERTAAQLFPGPGGEAFLSQDLEVIRSGLPLMNALELHTYHQGEPGWCLTTKLPLFDAPVWWVFRVICMRRKRITRHGASLPGRLIRQERR